MHAIENAKIIRNYFRESSKKSIEMIKFTEIIFFHQRSYNLQIKLNIINSKGDKKCQKCPTLWKKTLKHQNFKEHTCDKDKADEYMEQRSYEEDEQYEIPKLKYHTKVKSKEMFGCQMIIFNESLNTDKIILYLHGGAYVSEINKMHITFCDKIAKKTNSTVFAPIYPLAPNHTYDETYKIVENLYNLILKFNQPVTIIGDSAGEGLSASFCEYLTANEITQPKHLILISPWVDVSMSGDYEDYIDLDPMLGVDGLREMGENWAVNLDSKDYKVSPLF